MIIMMNLLLVTTLAIIPFAFAIHESMKDKVHGIKMGVPLNSCDDAEVRLYNSIIFSDKMSLIPLQTGLEMDWDGSPVNYTCFRPKTPIGIRDFSPIISCTKSTLPPLHFCMDTPIKYNQTIPSSGSHRPLWPVFGEYKYVPPQRWVHNLEHGAVVMLYDPCAHPVMVEKLRRLVVNCIRKHVITPFRGLSRERPLALVTWGCVMEMNYVRDGQVIDFIRSTGMKAPERDVVKEGQYRKLLLKQAHPPFGSNMKDAVLCPFAP